MLVFEIQRIRNNLNKSTDLPCKHTPGNQVQESNDTKGTCNINSYGAANRLTGTPTIR